MRVEWHGQSAFTLDGRRRRRSSSTPSATCRRCWRRATCTFDYPPIEADGRRPAAGHPRAPRPQRRRGGRRASPPTLRATAGTHESPIGEVRRRRLRARRSRPAPSAARTRSSSSSSTACASPTSATSARPRCAPSRREAIGEVDLLILPVGGGPTIGADAGRARSSRELDAALGRADALPHRARRLPRARRRRSSTAWAASSAWRAELRHGGPARGRRAADRGARRALIRRSGS